MKKIFLFVASTILAAITLSAQVTQINSNKSLELATLLTPTKAIFVSEIDSSIWVTDGTLSGTFSISTAIKYEGYGGILSGKFIFRGRGAGTGSEIYITDGTTLGTVLVKDIYPGISSSIPSDFIVSNGLIYFSAITAAEGRELWKSDGTTTGTTLLKDIVAGPDSSNQKDKYYLTSNGTYLLFAARTASSGIELWRSDGSSAGTQLLLDINTGNAGADSSNPRSFFFFNGITLFTATDATHGNEIWKTDGTAAGTTLLKDINVGLGSSTSLEFFPGFSIPVFLSFHIYNNKAYFNAYDGSSNGQVWVTDGTSLNTTLLKEIIPGISFPSYAFLINSVNLPNKFIFSVFDGAGRTELWQSDGTPAGTVLFKSFTPFDPLDFPIIAVPFYSDFSSGIFSQTLFQGNKFFFSAGNSPESYELWISDGTLPGTTLVKDIFPGVGNGIDSFNISYLYTSTQLFFAANNGINGIELWKSDGTGTGTSLVFDINPNAPDALPELSLICNGKIIFTATDGDDPKNRDLYAVDGIFAPLPIKLSNFTVTAKKEDALLQWTTLEEINASHFSIQRSYDAINYETIGKVLAFGNSSNKQNYSFTDKDIINSGKTIVYYRLLTMDKDGKSEFSKVLPLKLKANEWNVRLMNNPVKDQINILLQGITGEVQITLNDMGGKTIYSKKLLNTNEPIHIPAANIPNGTYVLVVTSNNEKKAIRFVK